MCITDTVFKLSSTVVLCVNIRCNYLFRLDKWMLDMTEGPCRMRKKMMRNDLFYLHYPYRPELDSGDNKALKYKVASSWDSKEFYQKYRPQSLLERDRDYVLEAQLQPEDPSERVMCKSTLRGDCKPYPHNVNFRNIFLRN